MSARDQDQPEEHRDVPPSDEAFGDPPEPDEPFWADEPTQAWSIEESVEAHGEEVTPPTEPLPQHDVETVAIGEVAEQAAEHADDVHPEPIAQESRAHAEPLPSIEEMTFEPAAPPAATSAPPPPDPRPYIPRVLSKRRFATLRAFGDALLPRGGPVPESASDVQAPERLDAALGGFDPHARRMFVRMLRLFDWGSVVSRNLRGFHRLKPDARAAHLTRALRSRFSVRRGPAELVKFYLANQWASSARVEQAIGFTYGCVSPDPATDGEALEVLSYPQINRDHTEECDVVVVGSGAGGAVMARELAELGLSVVVVEEGASYTRNDFTGPPFDRFLRLYRRQGMTIAYGSPAIPLPMGMAVGGSTLVNSGTCFRTPDRVLSRWERDFGLDGIDPQTMKPFFDRVERILHVKQAPDELLGRNTEVFARGVKALGFHGQPIRRAIEGCRGCGVCAFGCPSDAKMSTHLTYLPRAQRAGATIFANARADRIVVQDGRARGIVASLLDPKTREPKAALTVRAKITVLAAGSVHTPALLAASALGNRSGHLGRHLRVHPASSVSALFEEEVYGWRGTLQSYFVDDWHESNDMMIEVTSSVPSVGAGSFPGSGSNLKEVLGRYPHVASAGLFVSDTSSGRVSPRRGREPFVRYNLNRLDAQRMVRGLARVTEIFLAAGARAVITGIPSVPVVSSSAQLAEVQDENVAARYLRLTAFHPVGTARMGPDPVTSVVDPWGEVHGVRGLFVGDASVLPGCPTVNPQVTIMAFATRTADHIARRVASYVA